MGSDESHFNVSVGSDGQIHKTVSTNHNLFEEKGEPNRYQTEVLLLTSLSPYRKAKPAHKMHSTESRVVIGPSNILFAGVSVCIFLPGNFSGWGCERVKERIDDSY